MPTSPIAVRTAFDLSWFRPPSFGSRAVHGKARFVRSSDVPWRCKEHVCASDAQRMERTAAAVGGLQVPPLETFPVEDPLSCPAQLEDGRDPLRGMFISDPSRVRSASIGRSFGFEREPSGRRFPFRWIPPVPCGGGERKNSPLGRDPGGVDPLREFSTRVNPRGWEGRSRRSVGHNWTTMATHLSGSERDFVRDGVVEDVRTDGRRRIDFRKIYLQKGNIPQANGSSRVTVGRCRSGEERTNPSA